MARTLVSSAYAYCLERFRERCKVVRVKARVVLSVLAALTVVPAVASAHTKRFATEVTIGLADYEPPSFPTDPPDHFEGWVSSKKEACEPRRLVRAFRQADGAPAVLLGEDRSEDDGFNPDAFWALPPDEDPPNGIYYATVKRRTIESSGHKHICRNGRSDDLFIIGQ